MAITIPQGTDQQKAEQLRNQLNGIGNKPQNNPINDKINSIYDSQFKAQQTALENAKQNALAEKQQQMQQKLPQFHNQKVGVDTDSALQMRKQNEMMAAQGVRGGDNITAAARNNTNRANQIQAIQTNENDYVRDMQNQMSNIERDYAMQIAQAQAQGDFNKANALLQQLQKEDDRNYQKEYDQSIWDRNTAREDSVWDRNNKYNETQTQGDRNWQQQFWQTQANWDKQQQLEQWQRQIAENKRQEGVAAAKSSYSSGGNSGGLNSNAPTTSQLTSEFNKLLKNDIKTAATFVQDPTKVDFIIKNYGKDVYDDLRYKYYDSQWGGIYEENRNKPIYNIDKNTGVSKQNQKY